MLETQLDRFTELGLEPPTLIDRNAQPIKQTKWAAALMSALQSN